MNDVRPEPLDDPVDGWLAVQHDRLVTGLTSDLDLDLGLRDATLFVHPRNLADDLANSIDLTAGLTAVFLAGGDSTPPPPAQPPATDLAQAILDAPPAIRLHLRVWTLALADAIDLAGILDCAIGLDPTLDLDRVRALAVELIYAHDLVLALDRDLRHAPALARARDLARARARARAVDVARTLDLDSGDTAVPVGFEILGHGSERLRNAVTDLIGADLTGADLTGVPLGGIRWSRATRWPQPWAHLIERDSVPIGDGVYEYRPGSSMLTLNRS